jgi:hypothetical protein
VGYEFRGNESRRDATRLFVLLIFIHFIPSSDRPRVG